MLDHVKSIIADIKNIFNKLVASGNYDEISAWQSDMEALDKLNNMMLDALAEIEHTNSQTQKNTSEEVKNSTKIYPDMTEAERANVLRNTQLNVAELNERNTKLTAE